VTEVDVHTKFVEFRKSFGMFLEPSFDTIAGVGSNGAIIHYRYRLFVAINSDSVCSIYFCRWIYKPSPLVQGILLFT
jgi:Xaa-Pro aminopeptidase